MTSITYRNVALSSVVGTFTMDFQLLSASEQYSNNNNLSLMGYLETSTATDKDLISCSIDGNLIEKLKSTIESWVDQFEVDLERYFRLGQLLEAAAEIVGSAQVCKALKLALPTNMFTKLYGSRGQGLQSTGYHWALIIHRIFKKWSNQQLAGMRLESTKVIEKLTKFMALVGGDQTKKIFDNLVRNNFVLTSKWLDAKIQLHTNFNTVTFLVSFTNAV